MQRLQLNILSSLIFLYYSCRVAGLPIDNSTNPLISPEESCTTLDEECVSNQLFCDTSSSPSLCRYRLPIGYVCAGYTRNICFQSRCIDGLCRNVGGDTETNYANLSIIIVSCIAVIAFVVTRLKRTCQAKT